MTMRTRSRAGLGGIALAGTLALTALAAACGGTASGSASKVASVGEATTTTAPAGDGSTSDKGDGDADVQDAMLAFAQCMRDHGIDMPDPQMNSDGRAVFTAGQAAGDGAPLDKTKMDEAQQACQEHLDKVRSETPAPDPAEMEARKQQMLDFAQCMRDHGVDMADPQFSTEGGGLSVSLGGPGTDPNSPAWKEANETCSAQVGMEQPGGPGGAGGGSVDSGSGNSTGAVIAVQP